MPLFIASSIRKSNMAVDSNESAKGLIFEKKLRRGLKQYFINTVISVANARLVGTDVYFVMCIGI